MDDQLSRLEGLPPNIWGLHEAVLCQELDIKAKENLSVRTQLTQLLSALKIGYSGQKQDNSCVKTGYDKIDLYDKSTPNSFDIHYSYHGAKESFPTDSLKEASHAMHQPRYFIFGGCKADEKGQGMVDRIKTQYLIMRSATGESKRNMEDEVSQRRQANWLLWYQKEFSHGNAREFEQIDLPLIAHEFSEMWAVTIRYDEQGRIPRRILAGVQMEIREILRRCNRIPRRTRVGNSIPDDHQVPSKLVSPPVNKRKRSQEDGSQEDDATVDSTKKPCATPTSGLPHSLTLEVLRKGDLNILRQRLAITLKSQVAGTVVGAHYIPVQASGPLRYTTCTLNSWHLGGRKQLRPQSCNSRRPLITCTLLFLLLFES
jgi:hypothetical protein